MDHVEFAAAAASEKQNRRERELKARRFELKN